MNTPGWVSLDFIKVTVVGLTESQWYLKMRSQGVIASRLEGFWQCGKKKVMEEELIQNMREKIFHQNFIATSGQTSNELKLKSCVHYITCMIEYIAWLMHFHLNPAMQMC